MTHLSVNDFTLKIVKPLIFGLIVFGTFTVVAHIFVLFSAKTLTLLAITLALFSVVTASNSFAFFLTKKKADVVRMDMMIDRMGFRITG